MQPTIGRIVQYKLTADDAAAINSRRAGSGSAAADWPKGAIEHHGNPASEGQVLPAMVVVVHNELCVNLQVYLDGNDTLWVTSAMLAPEGSHGPREWVWPART